MGCWHPCLSEMYEKCVFCRTSEFFFFQRVLIPSSAFTQVKAVGKTFHKTCLICAECGTSLHSNKLLDHDGDPFCVRCHSKVFCCFSPQIYYCSLFQKLYGPQGNGYALLG